MIYYVDYNKISRPCLWLVSVHTPFYNNFETMHIKGHKLTRRFAYPFTNGQFTQLVETSYKLF